MKEAQRHISAAEFGEWKAFDRRHPIGWERFDILAASVAMVAGNAWSKRPRPLEDYQVKWGRKRRLTVGEIEAKGQAFLASLPKGRVEYHGRDDRQAGSHADGSDG